MHDLLIRDALVADGTGAAPFPGDVAVQAGRIVAVARRDRHEALTEAAHETIAAGGAVLTPGFIDPHTHYDGQATWDDQMLPSAQHGVTTVMMGNCGVGFAPLQPGSQDVLIRLMEGVEDIPGVALAEGLRWNWRSFAEYLDVLASRPRTLNVATQVPHDPLRLAVMGERASARERATAADTERMAVLLREALLAGAFGFSTGRTDNHRTSDGHDTPASVADAAELTALAATLRGLPHRTLSAVSDFDQARGPEAFDAEFDLLEAMVGAAGRPLTLSWMQRLGAGDQWQRVAARAEAAAARGLPMRLQCAPRGIGVLLSLATTFNPLLAWPSYQPLMRLPLAERAAMLQQPEFLQRLRHEQPVSLVRADNSVPPAADMVIRNLAQLAFMMFPLGGGEGVDYEPDLSRSLGARARASGRSVIEEAALALAADDGRAFIYFPIYNLLAGDFSVVNKMMAHPLMQLGLGDSGAHVATISDGAYPSFLLQHWVRDRTRGPRMAIERAVHLMSGDIATHFGMADRGRVATGCVADLNLLNLDVLSLGAPEVQHDLPAGGTRILQSARGWIGTWVNGVRTLRNDALTGALPGGLLRAAR